MSDLGVKLHHELSELQTLVKELFEAEIQDADSGVPCPGFERLIELIDKWAARMSAEIRKNHPLQDRVAVLEERMEALRREMRAEVVAAQGEIRVVKGRINEHVIGRGLYESGEEEEK